MGNKWNNKNQRNNRSKMSKQNSPENQFTKPIKIASLFNSGSPVPCSRGRKVPLSYVLCLESVLLSRRYEPGVSNRGQRTYQKDHTLWVWSITITSNICQVQRFKSIRALHFEARNQISGQAFVHKWSLKEQPQERNGKKIIKMIKQKKNQTEPPE